MAKLRFFKVIIGILTCAMFALFYAHQEIEIVKTSFKINKNRNKVSFLLDQYRSLVYNLSRLESPERIEKALCANEIVLCMPETQNVRRFHNIDSSQEKVEKVKTSFLASVFDRFSTKAEAEVVR